MTNFELGIVFRCCPFSGPALKVVVRSNQSLYSLPLLIYSRIVWRDTGAALGVCLFHYCITTICGTPITVAKRSSDQILEFPHTLLSSVTMCLLLNDVASVSMGERMLASAIHSRAS